MLIIHILLWTLLKVTVIQSAGLSALIHGLPRACYLCRSFLYFEGCGVSGTNRDSSDSSAVTPHEYPWLVAINIGSKIIAGSLISDQHILTAASPLYGLTPDRVVVTLGVHDRCIVGGPAMNVTVASIIIRSGFSPTSLENDLAMLKLSYVIAFSEYISPICLPVFGIRDNDQVTWTAGWSQSNGNCTPQVAVLPLLPAAACNQAVLNNKQGSFDKGCLGPLGVKNVICKDDVGSPVMAHWLSTAALRLIGVISSSSCNATTPPVYTKVINHVAWIYEHIRKDCNCF